MQFVEQQDAPSLRARAAADGMEPPQRMGQRPAAAALRTTQPAARRLWKEG